MTQKNTPNLGGIHPPIWHQFALVMGPQINISNDVNVDSNSHNNIMELRIFLCLYEISLKILNQESSLYILIFYYFNVI